MTDDVGPGFFEVVEQDRGNGIDAGVHAGHGGGKDGGDEQSVDAVGELVNDVVGHEAVGCDVGGEWVELIKAEQAESDKEQS